MTAESPSRRSRAACTCGQTLTPNELQPRDPWCPIHGTSKTRAPHPFWLDGGYDRASVKACPYHPIHRWWTFRLGDVLVPSAMRDPDERMVICRGCYVPRCGHTTEENPCVLPRHHEELHLYADGGTEDPTVWPGDQKPAARSEP